MKLSGIFMNLIILQFIKNEIHLKFYFKIFNTFILLLTILRLIYLSAKNLNFNKK